MASRILLIQLRRIGDVLMTTPALAALRAAYPEARISYLTEAPCNQLFSYDPHVDEVLVYPRKASLREQLSLLRGLRAQRFDLVVDFFSNPRTAVITRCTGARRRVGFDFQGRRWGYTDPVRLNGAAPYSAAHKAALVECLGVRVPSLTPRVYLGDQERAYARQQLRALGVGPADPLVALCPVSRRSYRTWPAERYACLADFLIERYGAKVMLIWGPGEEAFATAVRKDMVHRTLPDYPMPTLLQLAALLERAGLFVGNDGGPRHLAIALGRPTLTVFGKDFASTWTPPAMPMHRTIEYDPGCKASCHYPHCGEECIRDVPYGAVEQAVGSYLEELLRDGPAH